LGYLTKKQKTSNRIATSTSQFELFLSLTLQLSDLVFNTGSIIVPMQNIRQDIKDESKATTTPKESGHTRTPPILVKSVIMGEIKK
jgi:hypothetical protein